MEAHRIEITRAVGFFTSIHVCPVTLVPLRPSIKISAGCWGGTSPVRIPSMTVIYNIKTDHPEPQFLYPRVN